MKSNKCIVRNCVILAVILAAFNVLAFVIPFKHTTIFWIGYGFGMLAILACLLIFVLAFKKGESAKSRFYGFPIARVGVIYAAVQLILSFITMGIAGISGLPVWPFVLVFVLLFGAAVLGAAATDAARDEIERQDVVLNYSVSNIRELRSLGGSLVAQCADPAAREELRKLSETLNYCDPVSSAATVPSENELRTLLDEIQRSIVEGDTASVIPLAKRASTVLAERNRLCKLNK